MCLYVCISHISSYLPNIPSISSQYIHGDRPTKLHRRRIAHHRVCRKHSWPENFRSAGAPCGIQVFVGHNIISYGLSLMI